MISDLVKLAKIALADVDRNKVIALLDCINLTTQERELIERTELKGERLSDQAELFALVFRGSKVLPFFLLVYDLFCIVVLYFIQGGLWQKRRKLIMG